MTTLPSSDPIETSKMTNGEKNGSGRPPKKNRKRKNQNPGVSKVTSDGKSPNAPKKVRNESEPGNANASKDSEVLWHNSQYP